MKPLPEDVIVDLLPLYFADEASAASRTLVEMYFEANPKFAATVRESMQVQPALPPMVVDSSVRSALRRVKSGLRLQAVLIAVGIFFSLLPLTFMHQHGKFAYLMLRDEPLQAGIFICIALADWAALWLLLRRMNSAQFLLKEAK